MVDWNHFQCYIGKRVQIIEPNLEGKVVDVTFKTQGGIFLTVEVWMGAERAFIGVEESDIRLLEKNHLKNVK